MRLQKSATGIVAAAHGSKGQICEKRKETGTLADERDAERRVAGGTPREEGWELQASVAVKGNPDRKRTTEAYSALHKQPYADRNVMVREMFQNSHKNILEGAHIL